jgi:TRAP-type C4-dicarboxylate transport system permease small subunit
MKTVTKVLNRFILISYDAIEAMGAAVVFLVIFIVTAGIVSRYFLNQPLTWVEELCCLLLIWLCYLSASVTTVLKEHVVADFISSLFPKRVAKVESYIIRVLEVVFLIFTAYAATKLLPSLTMRSAVLHIPRACYYLPVIAFSAYMGLAVCVDLLNEAIPGYNYFQQRQDERAALEAAELEKENTEMLKREADFMEESGIEQASPKNKKGGRT